MAGTILVRDAIWRLSTLLNDVSPQFTRWSEQEIVNYINDAQLAISKFLPAANSRIVAVKLKPGTLQSIESVLAADHLIDGAAATATMIGTQVLDILNNMGVDGLTPGAAVRLATDGRDAMDTVSPNWHTSSGTAVRLFFFDPRTPRNFLVSPGVHAATAVWVRMALTAQPTRIANTGTPEAPVYHIGGGSTVLLSVSDDHIDDVVNYCAARCYLKNAQFSANDPKVATFTALFTGSLNAKVSALTGNNPNLQRLPFAPEPIGAAS